MIRLHLCVALNLYKRLILHTQSRIRLNHESLFYIDSYLINHRQETDKFKQAQKNDIEFLYTNIKIADLDRDLKSEIHDFKQLVDLQFDLENKPELKHHSLQRLLTYKAEYLKTKWILRHQYLKRKSTLYLISDDREIELREEIKGNPIFDIWTGYIHSLYEFTKDNSFFAKLFKNTKHKDTPDLTLLELHTRIKFFKDIRPDLEKLNICRKEIQNRYKQSLTKGLDQQYSYAVALNYSVNNEFSLLLEAEDVNNTRVSNLYKEILEIQYNTGINNFFCQFKYLSYLVKKLKSVYAQKQILGNIQNARIIIEQCDLIILAYRDGIDWVDSNYNYVFHLPYDESLVSIDNGEVPCIYMFSSFLLPLSKEKYVSDFDNFEREVNNYRSSIEVLENVEGDIKQFNELKKEIQAREIKSMEIIGIFTAIVTFLAVSIPAFKYIHTAFQALLFMLTLSMSLSVFVLLILSVSRGVDRVVANLRLIIPAFIISIFLWVFLVYYSYDPSTKQKVTETSKNEKIEANTSSIKDTQGADE